MKSRKCVLKKIPEYKSTDDWLFLKDGYVELPLDVPIRVRPRFELVSLIIGCLLEGEDPGVYLFPVEDGRVFIVFLPPL